MFTFGSIATSVVILILATEISGDFEVPSHVEAHVGDSATLRCKLQGYYRWYVISWIRRDADGSEVTIVRLPSDTKTPEWASDVDYGFKTRVKQKITVETDMTEFNLVLKNVNCADRGLYVCMYVGRQQTRQKVLQLSVKVEPMRPSIHKNYLIIDANSSFIIDCYAKVGYPPKRLVWLKKPTEFGEFQIIENNRPLRETRRDDCDITIFQPLEIFANKNHSGMTYRCAYDGEFFTSGMYAEVEVHLPAEVRTLPPTIRHDCLGGSCPMEAVGDGYRGSSAFSKPSICILLFTLVTLL